MKLHLPGPFITCVIAEFPVYDLQMQPFLLVFFFQDTKYVGTVGGGKGSKSKITNCHLI